MKKKCGGMLSILLAFIMTFAMVAPSVTLQGFTADPGGFGQKVNYRHRGGDISQVQDPDWVNVWCLFPSGGYSDKHKNENFRWKYDLWANQWLFDNSQNSVNGSNKPGSGDLYKLVSILWYAQKMTNNEHDIQNAVWWFVTNGADNHKTNLSNYNNYIVQKAGDDNWPIPENFNLYMYVPDNQAYTTTLQNSVRLETNQEPEVPSFDEPEWQIDTTAVYGNQTATNDKPITIQLEPGQESTGVIEISDKVQYSNMTDVAGKKVWFDFRFYELNDDGTVKKVHNRGYISDDEQYRMGMNDPWWVNESGEGEWSDPGGQLAFWKDLKPGKYVFGIDVYNPDTGKYVDHTDLTDKSEMIIVLPADDVKVTNTTAKAKQGEGEEVVAKANQAARITVLADEEISVTISDTVEYEGLNANKTYTIESQLWSGGSQRQTKTTTVQGQSSGSVNVTFNNPLNTAGTYNIRTYIKEGSNIIASHNGSSTLKNERVVIVKEEEELPEPEPVKVLFQLNKTGIPAGKASFRFDISLEEGDDSAVEFDNGGVRWTHRSSFKLHMPHGATFSKEGTYKVKIAENTDNYELYDGTTINDISFDAVPKTFTVVVTKNEADNILEATVDGETPDGTYDAGAFKNTYTVDKPTVATSAAGGTSTLKTEANQSITDTVTLTNLVKGVEYTITGKLMVKEDRGEVSTYNCIPLKFVATAANETKKMQFFGIDASDLGGKSIVVFETLSWETDVYGDGTKEVAHEDYTDTLQTVQVDEKAPGVLKTTVTAGGKSGSKDAPAEIKVATGGEAVNVTDKIDYENLTPGATYTVSGTLVEVANGEVVNDNVATATAEKKASDTGRGSWEITFEGVTLEPGKTYVVFEKATNKSDWGDSAKHEDPTDDAQTVVTEEKEKNPIEVTTQVKNQFISPAENQSITDDVTLKGLEDGKTYTLKGVIKNKKDGSDVDAVCIPLEVDSSSGVCGVQFIGIDASGFKDGDKLVVFEYLYEGSEEETKDFTPGDGNEVASHTDLNDAAQTATIVDGQIKLKKTTDVSSVRPGDVIPYTITVTNERRVPVTVQIVDTPDAGLKYIEASDDGEYDSEVGTIVWDNLEVPANGSVSVSAFFVIEENASGKLTNRAHVFEPDNPENVLGVYEDAEDIKVLGAYEDSDNNGNKKVKGANTGDDAPLGAALIAFLAAAGAFEFIRRRRTN